MDDQNKNLILATALSFLVILVWFVLFPPPEAEAPLTPPTAEAPVAGEGLGVDVDAATTAEVAPVTATQSAEDIVANAPRVTIDSPSLITRYMVGWHPLVRRPTKFQMRQHNGRLNPVKHCHPAQMSFWHGTTTQASFSAKPLPLMRIFFLPLRSPLKTQRALKSHCAPTASWPAMVSLSRSAFSSSTKASCGCLTGRWKKSTTTTCRT